jgi:Putative polyhydroxyalkanoic acid system protein (PHA_gran_rgn)
MPNIQVSVPHQLSQDEALKRIQRAIAQTKAQNPDKIGDLKETWDGYEGAFSASAMGYSASGTISVNPAEVTVQSTLPPIAVMFKGKIEGAIRDMLTRLLA